MDAAAAVETSEDVEGAEVVHLEAKVEEDEASMVVVAVPVVAAATVEATVVVAAEASAEIAVVEVGSVEIVVAGVGSVETVVEVDSVVGVAGLKPPRSLGKSHCWCHQWPLANPSPQRIATANSLSPTPKSRSSRTPWSRAVYRQLWLKHRWT